MNFFARKNIILIMGDVLITFLSAYAGVYLRLYISHFFPRSVHVCPSAAKSGYIFDIYDICMLFPGPLQC